METDELLAFGPFELDTRARQLLNQGVVVPLPPKSYETLVYLVRNRGRTVSREELVRQVWPDVVVSDGSLSQAVFVLRKALGESEEGARFVETVPRVGYRFGGVVEGLPEAPRRTPRPSRRVLALAAAAAIAIAAAGGILLARRHGRLAATRSPRLLSVVRELPVAADATRLLGHVETSSLLAAPGAYYLVPDDGSAPTRIPLNEGETPISVWDGALAVVTKSRVVLRDPFKQDEKSAFRLPPARGEEAARSWGVSPDGRFLSRRLGEEIEVLTRRGDDLVRAAGIPIPYRPNERLALGSRYLALARGEGDPLRVYALPEGQLALEAPLSEFRVGSVAVDDGGGRVAVGGPFDEIDVFRVGGDGTPVRIPRRGWTHGLAYVPDAPTLVASGYYGLAAFRERASMCEEPGAGASTGEAVLPFAGGLLVFSPGRHRIALVSYSGAPPAKLIAASPSVLWTVEHDSSGETVFAGGRDGKLYALDVATSRITSAAVHTDGIPQLVRDGDLLASSSDDKTVAVWKLPGPKLVRRETAHRYLVNDLAVAPRAGGGSALVTSSSDGLLKTWAWPTLEPRESIDVAALTARKSELHAVWTAPDLGRVLAGTWDGAVVDLRREGAAFSARRVPVRASVVYRLVELPAVGVVAGVGHDPAEVFVFDLRSGGVAPLEIAGLEAFWCVAEGSGSALVVVGNGGLSRYAFERQGRTLRYTLVTRRQSGLWLTAATLLPDGSLWAGTDHGELVRYGPGFLDGEPSAAGEVTLADPPAR